MAEFAHGIRVIEVGAPGAGSAGWRWKLGFAPPELSIELTAAGLRLSWTGEPAARWQVLRSTSEAEDFQIVASLAGHVREWVDADVTHYAEYRYRVRMLWPPYSRKSPTELTVALPILSTEAGEGMLTEDGDLIVGN